MNRTKQNILARLKSAPVSAPIETALDYRPWGSQAPVSEQDKLERFIQCLSNNHAIVLCSPLKNLTRVLTQQLQEMNIATVALGTKGEFWDTFVEASSPYSIRYFDQEIEAWKQELFNNIDVSITHCIAGVADTGALVLAPDQNEPRSLSLVPPRHIAVIKQSTLHCHFPQVIQHQGWAEGLPTNALLISGPSKTADIQQTLAYGAHGPRELTVIVITDI